MTNEELIAEARRCAPGDDPTELAVMVHRLADRLAAVSDTTPSEPVDAEVGREKLREVEAELAEWVDGKRSWCDQHHGKPDEIELTARADEATIRLLLAKRDALAVSPAPARDEWEELGCPRCGNSLGVPTMPSLDGAPCLVCASCKQVSLSADWEPLPVTEEER